ncbi:MAG: DotU family type IV/VI secretion system protein [Pirellulales bacterium]
MGIARVVEQQRVGNGTVSHAALQRAVLCERQGGLDLGARRDALEVYYVCVVLGFRGLYRDPALAAMLTQRHGIPADLGGWAKQVSMAIRLGQGRPALAEAEREVQGAPPLRPKAAVVWTWLLSGMLAAWNVIYFALFFSR